MIHKTEHTIKTFAAVLREIADNIMITDSRGVIEYVNPAFEATTGYSKEEVLGKTPAILRSGQHDTNYYRKLWETILAGGVYRSATINRKKTGDIYYADQTISPVHDETGKIVYFVSVWKDITERVASSERLKRLNEQLSVEKKKLEQVLGIESRLHSMVDLHKLIDFVVEKTCEVLEAQRCSFMFIDQESGRLCVKGHRGMGESKIEGVILKIGDHIGLLIESHCKTKNDYKTFVPNNSPKIDGTVYQSETFLSVPIELGDRLLGMINVSDKEGQDGNNFTDLDLNILFMIVRQVRIAIENAKLYRELKFLTITDPLTGIYNYRYFTQILDYEILRAKRYKRDLSFLMIDIDQFKSYNDTFGVMEGDKLLKAAAKIIKENVRGTDVVCRYTADEFAVIMPETDGDQARGTAERIRQKISEYSHKHPISVNIGLAQCSSSTDRYDLIQRADSQLHWDKRKEKNVSPT